MPQCQGVTSLSNHVQGREMAPSSPPPPVDGVPSPIHTGVSGIYGPSPTGSPSLGKALTKVGIESLDSELGKLEMSKESGRGQGN